MQPGKKNTPRIKIPSLPTTLPMKFERGFRYNGSLDWRLLTNRNRICDSRPTRDSSVGRSTHCQGRFCRVVLAFHSGKSCGCQFQICKKANQASDCSA